MLFPNVRGSAGYGKTFVKLDNGFKREESTTRITTGFWSGKTVPPAP